MDMDFYGKKELDFFAYKQGTVRFGVSNEDWQACTPETLTKSVCKTYDCRNFLSSIRIGN